MIALEVWSKYVIQSYSKVISFSSKGENENSGHPQFWQTHMAIYYPKDRKQQFVFSNSPFLWFISLIYSKWVKDNIFKVQNFGHLRFLIFWYCSLVIWISISVLILIGPVVLTVKIQRQLEYWWPRNINTLACVVCGERESPICVVL